MKYSCLQQWVIRSFSKPTREHGKSGPFAVGMLGMSIVLCFCFIVDDRECQGFKLQLSGHHHILQYWILLIMSYVLWRNSSLASVSKNHFIPVHPFPVARDSGEKGAFFYWPISKELEARLTCFPHSCFLESETLQWTLISDYISCCSWSAVRKSQLHASELSV